MLFLLDKEICFALSLSTQVYKWEQQTIIKVPPNKMLWGGGGLGGGGSSGMDEHPMQGAW